jgi:hypothetical protein
MQRVAEVQFGQLKVASFILILLMLLMYLTSVVFNLGYAYPGGTRRHLRGYVKLKK